MSKKFEVWLDCGENIHSCRRQTVSLDELGIEDAEWEAMRDDEQEEAMRKIAFDHADWGFTEIDN